MVAEDLADISGVIAEEVPDVGVLRDAAAGELGFELVDGATSVGVDEAPDQSAWMVVRQLELPIREDDRSEVLGSRPMLWKGLEDCRMADAEDVVLANTR
jgi:hypothetical protein